MHPTNRTIGRSEIIPGKIKELGELQKKGVAMSHILGKIRSYPVIIGYIVILAFGMTNCGEKAKVVGEVFDGFGSPLKDVTVSIEGTTFKATTNEKGKYSVGYVPGKIKISFIKDGYASAALSLDIAAEATFPAQVMTLYKIPSSEGIYLFGKADYMPLRRGKISFRSKKFPFSWNRPLFEETYAALGEFVSIEKATKLKFLDNDKINQQLFKLTDEGVILFRTKLWLETKDRAQMIKDESKKIAEGIYIREAILEKGKYAFVSLGVASQLGMGGIGSGGPLPAVGALGHPIAEPVYLFEVK